MSKIIYTQDIHNCGINSINRIGNYYIDLYTKLKEIVMLYKKNKCLFWLDGGDLTEAENVSNNIVDDMLDLIEENKINYQGLVGNHNMRYANFQASKGTSFFHMVKRSKNFNYLTELEDSNEKWVIKGIEYYYGMEEDIKKDGIQFDNQFNDFFKIAVVHGHLCEKKFPFASHCQYKDIITNADLVLVGHVHEPNEVKINNTTYLNIGCFGRRKINEANIHPSCLLIDTETRTWKIVSLKSAKPAEECFDLSKVEEEKQDEQKLNLFLEKIENFNFQSIDFRDRIYEFAKMNKEEDEVVNNIIQRLNKLGDKK